MISDLEFVSPLFVPASRPEIFTKAASSNADAIIFDLEDAITPQDKDKARANLPFDFKQLPMIVRVNSMNTPWFDFDVERCLQIPIAALVIPKVDDPAELLPVCRRLSGKSIPVIAMIESARGIANARSIAETENVCRLAFGSFDYCADVGCAHTREALLCARHELVLASRLSNISAPLDGITANFNDQDLAFEDARHSAMLGFGGKLCIHPSQVNRVRAGFKPEEAEVEWASRVLSVDVAGATATHGTMIDEPVRANARRIIKMAKEL